MAEDLVGDVNRALSFAGTMRTPTVTPEVVPATEPEPVRPKKSAGKVFYHWLSFLVFAGCLMTLFVGATHPGSTLSCDNIIPPTGSAFCKWVPVPTASPLIGWAIAVFCIYWFGVIMFFYLRSMNRHFDQANAPLPSLQEIADELRSQGFDPSIADCIALQNQIKMEKLEHGVAFGAMMIGPTLLARKASGKPTQ